MRVAHFAAVLMGCSVGSAWAQTLTGLGVLPGGTGSQAHAVSGDGNVVVGSAFFNTEIQGRAFRWTPAGGMVSLGSVPGGSESWANGVNSDGSVVVGECVRPVAPGSGQNTGVAFRWDAAGGMQELFLDTGSGRLAAEATGVSGDGSIVVGY